MPSPAGFGLRYVRPLSPSIANLFRNGDVEEVYLEPHQPVAAVALACVNAGWTREVFIEAALDRANKVADPLRFRKDTESPRPYQYVRREIERAWDSAIQHARTYPAIADHAEALALVANYRRRADEWHWPRRSGQTYRLVLEAHYRIVERSGSKIVHSGSVREIAELAGIGIATVERAHRFLRREGWLRLHRGAARHTREAAEWRLTAPTAATITADSLFRQTLPGGATFVEHIHPSTGREDCSGNVASASATDKPGTESVPGVSHGLLPGQFMPGKEWWRSLMWKTVPPAAVDHLSHDFWRPGASGKTAGAIYMALDSGWTATTAAELAAKMGLRRRTVERHLAKLSSMWLIARTRYGWLRGDANLDDVVDILGVAKMGEAQRKEHQRQRERFDDLIERGGHRGRRNLEPRREA